MWALIWQTILSWHSSLVSNPNGCWWQEILCISYSAKIGVFCIFVLSPPASWLHCLCCHTMHLRQFYILHFTNAWRWHGFKKKQYVAWLLLNLYFVKSCSEIHCIALPTCINMTHYWGKHQLTSHILAHYSVTNLVVASLDWQLN